jgi:hypothetical protein
MGYLWHKVSEKERDEIKSQARKILEQFSEVLARVERKLPKLEERKEEICERTEGLGEACEPAFRERILANAEQKNKDFILAEKKTW